MRGESRKGFTAALARAAEYTPTNQGQKAAGLKSQQPFSFLSSLPPYFAFASLTSFTQLNDNKQQTTAQLCLLAHHLADVSETQDQETRIRTTTHRNRISDGSTKVQKKKIRYTNVKRILGWGRID